MSSPYRATGTPERALLTDDDLVTGDAVALDLPAAGLGARLVSGLLDVVVTLVLLVALAIVVFIVVLRRDGAIQHIGFVLLMVFTFLVFPTALETLTRGRSLGKLAMGLRTVRDDAGPITFQHAFTRALIGFVEIYAFSGVPAFFAALLNGRGKRLGDYAAGTYVVRERMRLDLPRPPMMPPPLRAWADSADIAALPTGLAIAVRRYNARAGEISPQAHAEVGRRLAAQVVGFVAPPPPPGTPDWAFLAAVAATRRERDQARLAREQSLRRRLTAAAQTRR
ncbi:RDD family protein [Nocardioides acrostichi]|uniref:RDD family protein n=1 Tax=Nocardioides acrostichi TaxID=2784339 RepID=A0A930Y8D3_9ACTN|nr:RDD family protein [Nocardioides acrostichi]MBF4162997.1 RDD family protein [Nocardioides acrostichi]